MADTDLFGYRLELVEKGLTTLIDRLENDYLDKHELQLEYLSRLENERMAEKFSARRNSLLVLIGASVVSLCAAGSFILSLVQAFHG